jgi:hypothetical protein
LLNRGLYGHMAMASHGFIFLLFGQNGLEHIARLGDV